MLKNKSKIITLLIVIILSLTIPVVRAENETVTDNASETQEQVTTTSDSNTQNQDESENVADTQDTNATSNISEDSDENANSDTSKDMRRGDVYLTGDDVTIDYIVDGNLYVFAKSVTINSQIGGDVFAFAETVNVGEQGYVFSNLFTCAKNVNVSGVVYDLYASASNVQISGYVYRDIRIASNSTDIKGTIGRNAYLYSNDIKFETPQNDEEKTVSNTGIINGNLEYSSKKEVSIPDGAVAGTTKYNKINEEKTNVVKAYMVSLGTAIATVIVIWLLCLWLKPKFIDESSKLVTKKMPALLGYGILVSILGAITFIILVMIGITAKIAIIELMALAIAISISSSIFIIAVNNLICNKVKIEKNIGKFGMLIISSAILWAICLIPYVGLIIKLLASIIGLGIVTIAILPAKVNKKSENKKAEK